MYEFKDDGAILAEYLDKFNLMWSARGQFEQDWKLCDDQFDANTVVDNQNNITANVPLEKGLIETYIGRHSGKLNYNIIPNGKQADVQELQSAKYALDYFLYNHNAEYNFYNEKRKFLLDKAVYGTGIFYTGLTFITESLYDIQDGFYDNQYKEIKKEKRIFTPRHIPIRNIWMDYNNLYQPDFNKINIIVMQETVRPEILKNRWQGIKGFKNLDDINIFYDLRPAYQRTSIKPDECIIHYRFNKITKDYWIIANRSIVLYKGKLTYKHGRLPFTLAQHYPDNKCIYGEGICKRVRAMKVFKNTMINAMISKVEMSSGINIGIGNAQGINGDLYTGMGEINIRPFNTGIDQVKQFELNGNITPQANSLQVIDDLIIQDSGENIKAPYSSPTTTLGQDEIIEENKQLRQKSVDEQTEFCIADTLNQVLNNIQQYAYKLLVSTEEVEINGKKIFKIENPVIPVRGAKYNKKSKSFVEDRGEFGYFELKKDTLQSDIGVIIETNSNKSPNKIYEKNSITQYVANKQMIQQMSGIPLSQDETKELTKWMNLTYGLDDDGLVAKTKKDEIRIENEQLTNQMMSMMGMQGPSNIQQGLQTLQPNQLGVNEGTEGTI